jgi:hypothetical protein
MKKMKNSNEEKDVDVIPESDEALRDALNELHEPSKDVPEVEKPEDSEKTREKNVPESAEAEEGEESQEEADPSEDQEEGTPEVLDEEIKIPKNMPKPLRDILEKIENKKAVKEQIDVFKTMEASMQRKSQATSKERKFAERVLETFNNNGFGGIKDKIKYISNYIGFDRLMEKDPEKGISSLMRAYKINPSEFAEKLLETDNSSESDKQHNLQLQAIKNEILNLKNSRVKEETLKIQEEIETFKNTKLDNGNLKHPYYADLEPEMIRLAKYDPTLSVSDLYDKAAKLNDDIYKKILEDEKNEAVKKNEEKRKAKLKKSKSISKQNIKSRPSDTLPNSDEGRLKKALYGLYDK